MTDIVLPYKLVQVSGPDSERFLQGQFSCDVSALQEGDMTFGTANSPKGRMYFFFIIARIGDDFVIRAHEDIIEQALATLSKYKVFFKCEFAILSKHQVIGKRGGHNADSANPMQLSQHESGGWQFNLLGDSDRVEVWVEKQAENEQSSTEPNSADNAARLEEWFAEDCKAGIPELYSKSVDHFILQQLNLQELGAVSFKKGCYTGQEIIARMKFLGKLKKKTYLIEFDKSLIAAPLDVIYSDEGKKVGEVVRAHQSNHTSYGLAVVDIAYFESGKAAYFDDAKSNTVKLVELHYKTD
jgi:folate-binding protein YgfZ